MDLSICNHQENSREFAVAVKNRFEDSTDEELIHYLHEQEKKWILRDNKDDIKLIETAKKNFGLGDFYNYEDIINKSKKIIYEITYLNYKFQINRSI